MTVVMRDRLERAGATFVQAAVAQLVIDGAMGTSVSAVEQAAIAGAAAVLSLVQSWAAARLRKPVADA
jgi:hypothetical protein